MPGVECEVEDDCDVVSDLEVPADGQGAVSMTLDRNIKNNAMMKMVTARRIVRPRDPDVRSMLLPADLRDMECGHVW